MNKSNNGYRHFARKVFQRNRHRGIALRVMETDWPHVQQSIDNLIIFVIKERDSGDFPSKKTDEEIQVVLVEAIKDYEQLLYYKTSEKHPDYMRLSVFIKALIRETKMRLLQDDKYTSVAIYNEICTPSIQRALNKAEGKAGES